MQISAFGLTNSGRRRTQNQDSILCLTLVPTETSLGLFAVADGMGGQNAGEVASLIAIDTVREELATYLERTVGTGPFAAGHAVTTRLEEVESQPDASGMSMVDLLSGTMQRCNQRIREYGQQNPEATGLGSTLTITMVTGDLALIGNIGDSRTYIVRGGTIESLTEDHSLVGSLVRQGLISENDIYSHPHRNLIYNALGTKVDANPDIATKRLQSGDSLVLCSDGLWEMVRDEEILRVIDTVEDPQAAAEALIDMANANGGVDNISVVVVRVR